MAASLETGGGLAICSESIGVSGKVATGSASLEAPEKFAIISESKEISETLAPFSELAGRSGWFAAFLESAEIAEEPTGVRALSGIVEGVLAFDLRLRLRRFMTIRL